MQIVKLEDKHRDSIYPLFKVKKYMGLSVAGSGFNSEDRIAEVYHSGFCSTYLTNLKSYHAFGAFDTNGECLGIISAYQSTDEASWYGTNIRAKNNRIAVQNLLDTMIQFNESYGRYKFYTLWNARHAKTLRRYMFSDWANERYDYFDEMIVPGKTKCLYNSHWQVLFNRILLPHDTVIRCTFCKQKYRNSLPIGGRI